MTVSDTARVAPAAADPAPFRIVRSYFRLPPEPGGMEMHVASLSEAQRRLGIEVLNVYNVGEATGPALRLWPGRDLLHVRPASLRNFLFYSAAFAQRRKLRSKQPTILHVHGDWSDFMLAQGLARAIGAGTLAASLHDRIPVGRLFRYRIALRGFDLIFATGKADQLALERALGRPVCHLPSAPADLFFAEGEDSPMEYDVIGVTNFFPKKAPEVFLDCAARRPDLRFALFGDGPLREALLHRIAKENITNIVLPGRRSAGEVRQALWRSRLFLSTARREGTPTAALEAMASGLPVVLTPSNDYHWLISAGLNGYVTQGWDVAEIGTRIDEALADEPARQAMGNAARERAQRHSWRANAAVVSRAMSKSLGLDWEVPCVG